MSDKGKIFLGLILFALLVIFPLIYSFTLGKPGPRPELEMPVGETECVEAKDYMTAEHMTLLNSWRDLVVREGQKTYVSKATGREFEMSLTRTCMKCHTDRDAFCNRCHTYADVQVYCWECHIEPEKEQYTYGQK
jgi:hypothetical protein